MRNRAFHAAVLGSVAGSSVTDGASSSGGALIVCWAVHEVSIDNDVPIVGSVIFRVSEHGSPMAYLIWPLVGIVIAMVAGGDVLRRGTRTAQGPPFLAGAFGGFIGGVIGDGLPHIQGTLVNLPSIIGALLGALIFCLAVRERASDAED